MAWYINKRMRAAFESSPYSQAQGAESSAEKSSDGEPSAPSSLKNTHETSSSSGKKKDSLKTSRSGTTYAPLTDDLGAAMLTWYRADRLVKTSLRPSQMDWVSLVEKRAACGEKWQELSARFDHNTSSWRTHPSCEPVDSTSFSKTLPRWGMMQNGVLSALSKSAHPISATECGSSPNHQNWPTVQARDYKGSSGRSIKGMEMDLPTAIRSADPSLLDRNESGLWSPPQAGEGDRGSHASPDAMQRRIDQGGQILLTSQVRHPWLWRTPIVSDKNAQPAVASPVFDARIKNGLIYLNTQVRHPFLFPTPTVCGNNNYKGASKTSGDGLATFVKKVMSGEVPEPARPYWRTPCVSDPGINIERLVDKDGNDAMGDEQSRLYDRVTGRVAQYGVTQQVLLHERAMLRVHRDEEGNERPYYAGKLNPDWVEWLMGWPVGWTRIAESPDDYAPPVTEWWVAEPPHVPRIVSKTSDFSRRIRCIGNGQVPLCAATAFYILTEVL